MHHATLLLLAAAPAALRAAPVDELYAPLFGFDPQGQPAQPGAPDPLVQYTWGGAVNVTMMQRYEAAPLAVSVSPPGCVLNAEALLDPAGAAQNATFLGFGSLRLDFGVERAGWLEFVSTDLGAVLATGGVIVKGSISEYSEPWTGKTIAVTGPYDGGLFRLETNTPEIYEGVRFGWIIYESAGAATAAPWTVELARVQAQVKPVNYTADFNSSDPTLTAVWFSGAYGGYPRQDPARRPEPPASSP